MLKVENDLTKIFDKNLNTYNPDGSLNLDNKKLVNLKGIISKEIKGSLYCRNNKLITLEYCPKKIFGVFDIKFNPELKNVKKQIIENQIEAIRYETDEGEFYFEDIKEEFKKYQNKLKNIEKTNYKNEKLKETKKLINSDYGLSI